MLGRDRTNKPMAKGSEFKPDEPDQTWLAKHVQQARYSLQVIKCQDPFCCEPFVTNWPKMFPKRFLPCPSVYEFGPTGIRAVEPSLYLEKLDKFKFASLRDRVMAKQYPKKAEAFKRCPFDLYCPSMQNKLKKCVCKQCGSYWPSEAAMKRHAKCHKKPASGNVAEAEVNDEIEVEEIDVTPPSVTVDDQPMPVISSWMDHLTSPFQQNDLELLDEVV